MAVRARAVLCALLSAGFAPVSGPRIAANTLTALPAAGVAAPLRVAVRVAFGHTTQAWRNFQAVAGGSWQAAWDAATGVPRRIWGSGMAAPGANANPAIAEAFARQVLAAHVALLAPGASASDFELVSNSSDGAIRSLGFVQRAGGLRVVGGQISFEFKNDRLFVIGSLALPNVQVSAPRARLAGSQLAARATAALRTAVQLPSAPVTAPGADVILPLVADDTVLGYRIVAPLEIDGRGQGRYEAYADPTTGEVIAVRQANMFATGTVDYHGVDRWPGRGYVDRPAERAHVQIDGADAVANTSGAISWSPDSAITLLTFAVGDLAIVVNRSNTDGTNASGTFTLDPSGTAIWDGSTAPEVDAQINAYINTNLAKDYVRANLDASMTTLDDQMTVNVNEPQTCNAFFDGTTLNFFFSGLDGMGKCPSGTSCCENTGRLQDVNFHEYGHRVHTAEIITGVGNFDGAMSEGAADFLAASITNDSGMGRGFFFSDQPLREIDPPNREYLWPTDISPDIHATGLIYSGTLWDLRKALIAQYGATQGIAITNTIFVGTLRRSVDIPSSLIEALAADDDDGNLANGTPHECLIRTAYGAHGLRTATGTIEAPGVIDQLTGAVGVTIELTGTSSCGTDVPTSVSFISGLNTLATPNGPNRWVAQLPLLPERVTQYRAQIAFADGSSLNLPDNIADKFYETWTGPTVKLYCTGFEDGDVFAQGWTTGTNNGTPSTWQVAMPTGGPTNPPAPFAGTHILSQAPNTTYAPHEFTFAKTPVIDVGHYSDVHLQFHRWLAVQDALRDQARITANDTKAWENFTDTSLADASTINHIDKEWRFQDVSLSGYFAGTQLVVGWTLSSDGALQYAGWNLDDVCIVANPAQICGDGVRGPFEQCDNGSANADVPDTCRTYCRLPACGDRILDTGEECDRGSANANKPNACRKDCKLPACGDGIVDTGEECDGPGSGSGSAKIQCTDQCKLASDGCCQAGGSGAGAAVLAIFVLLVNSLTRSGRNRAPR